MKRLGFFALLTLVVILSSTAQSSSDGQRLVGTWVSEEEGVTIIFNANGTGTIRFVDEDEPPLNFNFFWGISFSGEFDLRLDSFRSNDRYIMEIFRDLRDDLRDQSVFLSPNGRSMIYNGSIFQKR